MLVLTWKIWPTMEKRRQSMPVASTYAVSITTRRIVGGRETRRREEKTCNDAEHAILRKPIPPHEQISTISDRRHLLCPGAHRSRINPLQGHARPYDASGIFISIPVAEVDGGSIIIVKTVALHIS